MERTTSQLEYRMPAEWELHEATWLSWPKDPDTFPPAIIDSVENAYCQIVKALQQNEKVNILVNDKNWEEKVRKKFIEKSISTKNVFFYPIKSVDVWTRDYAPTFVKDRNGNLCAIKWIFNAWGNKYDELKPDNKAGEEIANASDAKIIKPNIVLEGGSIDVNGNGALLTTEQCLLNKNRNPNLTKTEIEEYLKKYLGVNEIIWLKQGIAGDDTDGHVDDIVRFVDENTIVCAVEEDQNDENYKPLKENFELLKKTRFNIIPLPMPKKVAIPERRLPISYANFYIGNNAVLLPIFNDKNDAVAIALLQKCFPDRKIVPIYAKDIVYGYGGIHCITQQQPRI